MITNPTTTPTGILIDRCQTCHQSHPVSRPHCVLCARASVFLNEGVCLRCRVTA